MLAVSDQTRTSSSKKIEEERDWVTIACIVVAVIAGIITIFAGLCAWKIFPKEMLGGHFPMCCILTVGLSVTAVSAYVIYGKYKKFL